MPKNNDLASYRKQIAHIDDFIIQLIAQRMLISTNLGEVKKQLQVDIHDNKQEKKVLQHYQNLAKQYNLEKNLAEEIAKLLLNFSRLTQK
jgi:chorismate mutase / prephenate dehydrogenase